MSGFAGGQEAPEPGDAISPSLRIGDSERDVVVADLQAHYTDGRLELGEFEDRVTQARMARTAGELDGLLSDLPDLATARSRQRPATAGGGELARSMTPAARNALIRLAAFAIFFTGIWLFSSGVGSHFWPIYPILGIGLGTAFTVFGDHEDEEPDGPDG